MGVSSSCSVDDDLFVDEWMFLLAIVVDVEYMIRCRYLVGVVNGGNKLMRVTILLPATTRSRLTDAQEIDVLALQRHKLCNGRAIAVFRDARRGCKTGC